MKIVTINEMEKYYNLKKGEQFLYHVCVVDFFGIKYSQDYAILINASNKFILAKAYKNCLSIGSGGVREYNSYRDAARDIRHNVQRIGEIAKW